MTSENDPADERLQRYVEAAVEAMDLDVRRAHDQMVSEETARRFMAVADAEQAELRAEVESVRRGDGAAARDLSNAFRRAAAAEAKVARVEALRDELERGSTSQRRNPRIAYRINAALLAEPVSKDAPEP